MCGDSVSVEISFLKWLTISINYCNNKLINYTPIKKIKSTKNQKKKKKKKKSSDINKHKQKVVLQLGTLNEEDILLYMNDNV